MSKLISGHLAGVSLILFSVLTTSFVDAVYVEQEVVNKLTTQELVRVSITFEENISSDEILARLGNNFLLENKDEFNDQWIGGKINSAGLQLIQNDNRIKGIILSRTYDTHLIQSLPLVNSDQALLSQINRVGIKGRNNAACVIDSGIDKNHPDLMNTVVAEQCYCRSPEGSSNACCYNGQSQQSGTNSALDNRGHGTNVAGIIAANGRTKGIAPEAKLVAIKVCNSSGAGCNEEDIASAINWCVSNREVYNISVISISLGGGIYNNPSICDTFPSGVAITSAYNNKTTVIVSSGNDAATTGISSPACASKAISVGAVYDANVGPRTWGVPTICTDSSTQADKVVCFTNRYANLTVLAPGAIITSTKNGGGREDTHGTSAAAPHVSGAIALLKEGNSLLTPLEIKNVVRGTGKFIQDPILTSLYFPRLDVLAALQIDWPTFHHDNRRTGFTILKGDMTSATNVQRINLVLEGNVNQDHISRTSVSDLDNDGDQDIVIASSKLGGGTHDGIIFASEIQRILGVSTRRIIKKWQTDVGWEVEAPPSLGNIDSDKQKEVVFGFDNGTLNALDIASSGTSATIKWAFTVPKRYSQQASGFFRGNVPFTAIEDVDLDGKNEILFQEDIANLPDWPGNIYILEDNGNSATWEANYTLGNGGGRGAPSIADIDGDNKPEIIAPSYYGVFVFDYDNGVLTPKWSNTDGKLIGAVVVSDVDKDGEYELVYTTSSIPTICDASRTCYNRTYIRDAKTGNNEAGSPIALPAVSKVTPTVGDIDNDGNVEIVVKLDEGTGKIGCYEINGNLCSGNWPYNAPGVTGTDISPDIADIDGDGQYDIIFTRSNSKKIGVLNGNGNLKFEFDVDGQTGSAPAIADVDSDGVAEIAVKRAGSPITVLTAVSYNNQQPTFNTTMNITLAGVAGRVIDANKYGDLRAVDADNDNLNVLYSPPFNNSGQWQTTVNDTGDYISFVEVTDGNLSDVKELDVKVFSPNTKLVDTFADGATQKSLSYTGSESKQVSVRLPKNAKVIFSRLRIEGRTP